MTVFVIFVVVVLAIALVVGLLRRFAPTVQSPDGEFRVIKPLSDPEQALYWRLKEALPECIVLSQVTFSRFMRPEAATASARHSLLNRISRKTVDFLVCLPDFTVVAAVELDDRSHRPGKDLKRDALLRTAGISIIRANVSAIPSVDELRELFTK